MVFDLRICLQVVSAFSGVVLFVSCDRGGPASAAPQRGAGLIPVRTTKVVIQPFSDRVEALGTVRAFEAIDLSSNVTERVSEIFFDDGDAVKKGDRLIRLEDAEEKAALAAAQSVKAEQEREIARLKGLVKSGAVSDVRLREYETQLEIAIRRVQESQAKVDDRNIRAPYDGVLGFRRVSKGALVEPGDLIATFDMLDPVKLDFTVPETFLGGLTKGLEIEAETPAYPKETFTGKVTQIDTRVDPVTRSITVRAEIPNQDRRLRPGILMTTVLENNPAQLPAIPERALVSMQNRQFVFVVREGEPPKVSRIEVEIGRREGGLIEIRRGLEENDVIVTDGLIGLMDGSEVKVTGEFEGPSKPYRPAES